MLSKSIKAALIAATVFAAMPAHAFETGTRQKYRKFYQNVAVDDLPKLIAGKVWVTYAGDTNQIGATVFTADGREILCGSQDGITGVFSWKSVTFDNKKMRERYPLWQEAHADGTFGYISFKYVPQTGELYGYLAQRPYWWESLLGHLQTEIPAAVYTACPDFPSAKSLGLKVNAKQTSVKYDEMIKQDPGNRIKRPDLVTEVTVEKY